MVSVRSTQEEYIGRSKNSPITCAATRVVKRADVAAFGIDRECPHHGFGGSQRSHFDDQAAQNAAVAAEGDEIELHALDPDLGLVLDHEVEPAAIVGVLDTIELDADLFLSYGRCDRQQDLQNDERTQHATHG